MLFPDISLNGIIINAWDEKSFMLFSTRSLLIADVFYLSCKTENPVYILAPRFHACIKDGKVLLFMQVNRTLALYWTEQA